MLNPINAVRSWFGLSGDDRESILTDPADSFIDPSGYATASELRVDEAIALRHVPVFAAVTLIAEAMGALPLNVYRRQKPYGKTHATDEPIYQVFRRSPNEDMTPQTLIETLIIHAAIWGNGYAAMNRNAEGRVVGCVPLLPDRTKPVYTQSGGMLYETRVCSETRYLFPFEVIHIKGPSLNGVIGMNRIEQGKESLGAAIASERYSGNAFKNGVHPSGSVTHPRSIGPQAAKNLREDVEKQHMGLDAKHRVIVLQEGAEFKPFQTDFEKTQMVDIRRFSVEDAGRLFRVPSIMLNQTKDSNYSIGETLTRHFVTYTLQPWAKRFSQEIGRKGFREEGDEDLFVAFDFEDLLTADYAAKAVYYRELFNLAAIQPSEIREKEDFNPYPDPTIGMEPMVNGAYTLLRDLGRENPKQPSNTQSDDDEGSSPFEDNELLQVSQVARAVPAMKLAAVQKRLDRYRLAGGPGVTTNPNAIPPKPKYLYRWGDISSLFASEIASDCNENRSS